MSIRYASLYERLVANSTKPDEQNEGGCWPWAGNVDHHGYGRVTQRGEGRKHIKTRAHRAMEQLLRDNARQFAADDAVLGLRLAPTVPPVLMCPTDETLDHFCWLTGCVNPDHWEAVPNAENARRSAAARGWKVAA